MTITKFLYPIVDSGYFFTFELLEVIKEISTESFALKFRYSLANNYSIRFQIPIHISHSAHLNCSVEEDFESDKSPRVYSDRVMDVQNNKIMHGYGDDHHVKYEEHEKKEFLVLFKPTNTNFATFDTEFFMKPDDDEYGLYRLRYDFRSGQITRRYCLKQYPVNIKPFPGPGM
ncbi:MAG: hypothetical protein JNM55_10500 [Anaerolineales bacterium]|nr:hypothetical protein [Anaerolineales bacterium]